MDTIKVKFLGNYRGMIQRDSHNEYLAWEEGDDPDLDPELAAYIARDAEGILKGGDKILETANRMMLDGETRVAQEVAVEAAKDQAEGLDVDKMTNEQIADMLADLGLKRAGNKSTIVKRLKNALAEED